MKDFRFNNYKHANEIFVFSESGRFGEGNLDSKDFDEMCEYTRKKGWQIQFFPFDPQKECPKYCPDDCTSISHCSVIKREIL